jgi:DNA repair exonuclease SbcCD ATPase subunit
MKPGILPLINAAGCLVLTGLVVFQWSEQRKAELTIRGLKSAAEDSRLKAEEDAKRRAALERDITTLKDSITSIQQSSDSALQSAADKEKLAAQLQAELDAAREQLKLWDAAMQARDTRIKELDAALGTTRKRLDEAIERLKAAGAR